MPRKIQENVFFIVTIAFALMSGSLQAKEVKSKDRQQVFWPDMALAKLKEGNLRFVDGQARVRDDAGFARVGRMPRDARLLEGIGRSNGFRQVS